MFSLRPLRLAVLALALAVACTVAPRAMHNAYAGGGGGGTGPCPGGAAFVDPGGDSLLVPIDITAATTTGADATGIIAAALNNALLAWAPVEGYPDCHVDPSLWTPWRDHGQVKESIGGVLRTYFEAEYARRLAASWVVVGGDGPDLAAVDTAEQTALAAASMGHPYGLGVLAHFTASVQSPAPKSVRITALGNWCPR